MNKALKTSKVVIFKTSNFQLLEESSVPNETSTFLNFNSLSETLICLFPQEQVFQLKWESLQLSASVCYIPQVHWSMGKIKGMYQCLGTHILSNSNYLDTRLKNTHIHVYT